MRLLVAAVGRLKRGPERELAERYRERAVQCGRAVGLRALDIVEIAESTQRPVETVAGVYFQLSSKLGLAWLRDRIGKLPGDSHWQTLARGSMRDDLAGLQRTLAGNVLANGQDNDASALVAAWEARSRETMERASRLLGELRAAPAPDLAMLSVGLRELRNLA